MKPHLEMESSGGIIWYGKQWRHNKPCTKHIVKQCYEAHANAPVVSLISRLQQAQGRNNGRDFMTTNFHHPVLPPSSSSSYLNHNQNNHYHHLGGNEGSGNRMVLHRNNESSSSNRRECILHPLEDNNQQLNLKSRVSKFQ